MAPSRACSASILYGELRNAGVPASGASLRTFESNVAMVLDCSWTLADAGRGADKAPLPSTAKAPTRLMPDSHNARWESRRCGRLALDGFPADLRPTPSLRVLRKFRRGLNLIPRGHTHPTGNERPGPPSQR